MKPEYHVLNPVDPTFWKTIASSTVNQNKIQEKIVHILIAKIRKVQKLIEWRQKREDQIPKVPGSIPRHRCPWEGVS